MLNIFAPEITAINEELCRLHVLIDLKRQQQTMLSELESEASSVVTAIAALKNKVIAVKFDAAVTLKNAILNLFEDGGNDDGGNQPTDPIPQAGAGGDSEDDSEDDQDSDGEISQHLTYTQVIKNRCSACWGYEVQSKADIKSGFINRTDLSFMEAVNLERKGKEFYQTVEAYLDRLYYNGQSCEWVSPLQEEEQEEVTEEEEEFLRHPDCDCLAYVSDEVGKFSVFIGFDKKAIAKSWEKFIEPMALTVELENAMYLDNFKWELRCYGLSMTQVTKLAQCDFTQSYCTEIGSAKPPEPQKKYQPIVIEIGTKVTRLLTPSEVFEATSLVSNGTFFGKSELNGDRTLLNIDDVALVAPASESQKFAKVLLSGNEWHGQKLAIFSDSELGLTLRTPKGENIWYRRDGLEICDEEIESVADPTEPTPRAIKVGDRVTFTNPLNRDSFRKFEGLEMEVVRFVDSSETLANCLLPDGNWETFIVDSLSLVGDNVIQRPNRVQPAFGEAPGGLVDEPVEPDMHSILSVGDTVEIESDRYP